MNSRSRLAAWLKGIPPENRTDPFEMAVVQGMAAQEAVSSALRDFVTAEPETPSWLVQWATKLTDDETRRITAKRDEEQRILRSYAERVLDDDPAKWSDIERKRAETLGRRLAAANLVLRARDEAVGGQTVATFLPTVSKKAASTAA